MRRFASRSCVGPYPVPTGRRGCSTQTKIIAHVACRGRPHREGQRSTRVRSRGGGIEQLEQPHNQYIERLEAWATCLF